MTQELTIDAVRLALGMYQLRAQVAGLNIANAGTPSARASRIDFAQTRQALDSAAQGDGAKLATGIEALSHARSAPTPQAIQLDEEVAEMAAASAGYQTLTEALSRQFGLMRLAATGRS